MAVFLQPFVLLLKVLGCMPKHLVFALLLFEVGALNLYDRFATVQAPTNMQSALVHGSYVIPLPKSGVVDVGVAYGTATGVFTMRNTPISLPYDPAYTDLNPQYTTVGPSASRFVPFANPGYGNIYSQYVSVLAFGAIWKLDYALSSLITRYRDLGYIGDSAYSVYSLDMIEDEFQIVNATYMPNLARDSSLAVCYDNVYQCSTATWAVNNTQYYIIDQDFDLLMSDLVYLADSTVDACYINPNSIWCTGSQISVSALCEFEPQSCTAITWSPSTNNVPLSGSGLYTGNFTTVYLYAPMLLPPSQLPLVAGMVPTNFNLTLTGIRLQSAYTKFRSLVPNNSTLYNSAQDICVSAHGNCIDAQAYQAYYPNGADDTFYYSFADALTKYFLPWTDLFNTPIPGIVMVTQRYVIIPVLVSYTQDLMCSSFAPLPPNCLFPVGQYSFSAPSMLAGYYHLFFDTRVGAMIQATAKLSLPFGLDFSLHSETRRQVVKDGRRCVCFAICVGFGGCGGGGGGASVQSVNDLKDALADFDTQTVAWESNSDSRFSNLLSLADSTSTSLDALTDTVGTLSSSLTTDVQGIDVRIDGVVSSFIGLFDELQAEFLQLAASAASTTEALGILTTFVNERVASLNYDSAASAAITARLLVKFTVTLAYDKIRDAMSGYDAIRTRVIPCSSYFTLPYAFYTCKLVPSGNRVIIFYTVYNSTSLASYDVWRLVYSDGIDYVSYNSSSFCASTTPPLELVSKAGVFSSVSSPITSWLNGIGPMPTLGGVLFVQSNSAGLASVAFSSNFIPCNYTPPSISMPAPNFIGYDLSSFPFPVQLDLGISVDFNASSVDYTLRRNDIYLNGLTMPAHIATNNSLLKPLYSILADSLAASNTAAIQNAALQARLDAIELHINSTTSAANNVDSTLANRATVIEQTQDTIIQHIRNIKITAASTSCIDADGLLAMLMCYIWSFIDAFIPVLIALLCIWFSWIMYVRWDAWKHNRPPRSILPWKKNSTAVLPFRQNAFPLTPVDSPPGVPGPASQGVPQPPIGILPKQGGSASSLTPAVSVLPKQGGVSSSPTPAGLITNQPLGTSIPSPLSRSTSPQPSPDPFASYYAKNAPTSTTDLTYVGSDNVTTVFRVSDAVARTFTAHQRALLASPLGGYTPTAVFERGLWRFSDGTPVDLTTFEYSEILRVKRDLLRRLESSSLSRSVSGVNGITTSTM